MRRSLMFFAGVVLLASTAAAQNVSVAAASPAPAPAVTLSDASPQMATPSVRDDFPWQLSMSYQYMYFDFKHAKSNMNGANTTIVRFFNDHLGVEGSVSTEFGNFNNPNVYGRLFFYDGGVRWTAHRNGKWEPWIHADGGGVHLKETAFSGPFSFNGFSVIAGGGVDYSFHRRFSIRMQGDYVGTRISGSFQNSISAGAGFVINF